MEDTPIFTKNEKVLVFLKKAGREFSVAGLVQGKYIVENGEVRDISGEKVSLVQFTRDSEEIIKPYLKKYPELDDLVEMRTANVSLANLQKDQADASSSVNASGIPRRIFFTSSAGKPGGARVWDGYWYCRGSGCVVEIRRKKGLK